MIYPRDKRSHRLIGRAIVATVALASLALAGSCRRDDDSQSGDSTSRPLRVGIGQVSTTSPVFGLRQLAQILTVETLARPGEDGRMEPWVADGWRASEDGRSLRVTLKSDVRFHDGTPFDAATAAQLLPNALRASMGPVFDDIEAVTAPEGQFVEIRYRRPSPFLLEGLEAQIQKPGDKVVGTGAYMVAATSGAELQANPTYYLGHPRIDRVVVQTYPSVRAAWAEMLRNRLDMLYEVGSDALDSMESSSTISLFTFVRRYQYLIVLNPEARSLRSPEIRRALNEAIDRTAVVQSALNKHGIASAGPIWPRYWASGEDLPRFKFDPRGAAEVFRRAATRPTRGPAGFQFACLIPPDSVNERIALEVKRQLELSGVDMTVEETSQDQILQRVTSRQYDAFLIEGVSGPTLLRPYLFWHSNTPFNYGWGTRTVDRALDRVRHAVTTDEYRQAVMALQQAFIDDPPAVFLAWSERARAVSKRFDVPFEPGTDVLRTLRLWKPVTDERRASRN